MQSFSAVSSEDIFSPSICNASRKTVANYKLFSCSESIKRETFHLAMKLTWISPSYPTSLSSRGSLQSLILPDSVLNQGSCRWNFIRGHKRPHRFLIETAERGEGYHADRRQMAYDCGENASDHEQGCTAQNEESKFGQNLQSHLKGPLKQGSCYLLRSFIVRGNIIFVCVYWLFFISNWTFLLICRDAHHYS